MPLTHGMLFKLYEWTKEKGGKYLKQI